MPLIFFIEPKKPSKAAMPSLRSALRIFPRRAGYPDVHDASFSARTVDPAAALASLSQDLRGQNRRQVVKLRGRRRMFLLENGFAQHLSGGHRHAWLGDPCRTL